MRGQTLNSMNQGPLSSSHQPSNHRSTPLAPTAAPLSTPGDQVTEHSPEDIDRIPDIKFLTPCKGSKRGGPRIIVEGERFPSDRRIYVLFGASSTRATFRASNILHCNLPPSTVIGEVPVMLVENDLVTPIGRSSCNFCYEDDELEL
jgi:hypothetical protein